jgi:putative NADPH-quinone reductase
MSKRILVIDGHPDPDHNRFGHALAESYLAGARATGHEARLFMLADAAFPLLRSAAEFAARPDSASITQARDDLLWADHIVILFPLWLGGAPALLHGFLEQVTRAEFVAQTQGRRVRAKLKGRSARLIVTMGMPALIYRLIFHAHGVRTIADNVLAFGGVRPVGLTLFGAIETGGRTRAIARLKRVEALGRAGA